MDQIPFSKNEQAEIEDSILKMTNMTIKGILKRTKYNGVIIQLAYKVGHEIIELRKLLSNTEESNVTFGGPLALSDWEESVTEKRLENMVAVRRKIEKLVSDALQNQINFLLYSDNRFLYYSKENMWMDKHSMLSNLKQIEHSRLEDKKQLTKTDTEDSEFVADLRDIWQTQSLNHCNAAQNRLDLEQLQQDYVQCNRDMLYMLKRICGRRTLALFQSVFAASSEEIPDKQYVNVAEHNSASLLHLSQLGIVVCHPQNSRLVRMAFIQ